MDIAPDKPPGEMNLGELQKYCWGEIEKFRRKEANDDRFCLEIFHRALVLREEKAWDMLTQRFNGTILSWLRRHPQREVAYRLHSEENYVALTIERLWMVTVRNKSLEFETLAGALKFMHTCLNSVVIDALRSRAKETPIPESGFTEPAAPEYEEGSEFWESVKSLLSNGREQRLAYLLYHCGLKPRQIVQFCPQEFSDVQEIFRMTRNIMERLQRNKDRLRWLLSSEEF
jgi:DNA-directed RNA polymerase specialized sigma24 family protein